MLKNDVGFDLTFNIGHYPNRISNEGIYKLCGESPISLEVSKRRWSLFGHFLRMPIESPPQKLLNIVFQKNVKGRRGRPRITLITALKQEAQRFLYIDASSPSGLNRIRKKAAQRADWMNAFHAFG